MGRASLLLVLLLAACGSDPCARGGDDDGDGHESVACGGDDCDDGNAHRFPGNAERCDDIDDDCNPATLGPDDDGDGLAGTACCQPGGDGGEVCGTDCDDTMSSVHPGATEVCDGIDENCDRALDDGFPTMPYYADCDADGHASAVVAASIEACATPHVRPIGCDLAPSPAWLLSPVDDCDDRMEVVHPGAAEVCDGRDDDCDGTVDGAAAAAMCPGGPNVAMPSCDVACGFTCATGFLDCSASPGCETDGTTPTNCGMCGRTCLWNGCDAGTCDDAVELDGGFSHTCARLASGQVYCWGAGSTGALGDGRGVASATPVAAISDVVELAAGSFFNCGRHTSGAVSCWGINAHGQCGSGGSETNDLRGVAVSGLTTAVSIAAGNEHACAALADGTVVCWGRNDAVQLGDGTMLEAHAPVVVAGLSSATAVTAGAQHSCAIRGGGNVECWGENSVGQLGHGTTAPTAMPVYVSGVADAVQIVARGDHTCVLHATGTVSCWGGNTYGQLGDNTLRSSSVPVDVYHLTTAVELAAGTEHTCARVASGRVMCWGHDDHGQLGEGIALDSPIPVEVHGLTDAMAVGSGTTHSCARRAAGGVVCWGANASGQLGDGTMTDAGMSVAVLPP